MIRQLVVDVMTTGMGESGMTSPGNVTREHLDQLDELRRAASAGEWQLDGADNVFVEYEHNGEQYTDGLVSAAYTTRADAALIVAAVNAQPKLTAALRAVLELHKNDQSGAAAAPDPGMCEVCMWVWPCPTVRAITEAVG